MTTTRVRRNDYFYTFIFPLDWSAATMEDLFLFISHWFWEK
jgi:hypothetical protein